MAKILLVAEAANPELVSVPLVGWSLAHALARQHDVHLVTQIRNREAILRAGWPEDRLTTIDSDAVAGRLWRLAGILRGGQGKGWTVVTALNAFAYYYFERLLWQQFGPAIEQGEYRLVHRITPLSPTIPSLLARKCARAGVPFVLGPLNGGVPWPRAFDAARRKEREWLSYVRSAYKWLPGYRSTRRHAAAILIASGDTWQQMPERYQDKCFYLPENAIDPERFQHQRQRTAMRPLRVVFLGRLVPYKGADMLLEAAAPLLRSRAVHLTLIGDGPQRAELEAIQEREGVTQGIEWAGWVAHEQVQQYLADADLLALPSIREFGGGVVLEAMAVGLVPLVIAYGGPAELVDAETGFLIPLGNRAEIIERLRVELTRLVEHPEEIDQRSPRCRARVHEQFTWDAKAERVSTIYRWLLEGADRPEMPPPQIQPPR